VPVGRGRPGGCRTVRRACQGRRFIGCATPHRGDLDSLLEHLTSGPTGIGHWQLDLDRTYNISDKLCSTAENTIHHTLVTVCTTSEDKKIQRIIFTARTRFQYSDFSSAGKVPSQAAGTRDSNAETLINLLILF
jgi:hypothetical protein